MEAPAGGRTWHPPAWRSHLGGHPRPQRGLRAIVVGSGSGIAVELVEHGPQRGGLARDFAPRTASGLRGWRVWAGLCDLCTVDELSSIAPGCCTLPDPGTGWICRQKAGLAVRGLDEPSDPFVHVRVGRPACDHPCVACPLPRRGRAPGHFGRRCADCRPYTGCRGRTGGRHRGRVEKKDRLGTCRGTAAIAHDPVGSRADDGGSMGEVTSSRRVATDDTRIQTRDECAAAARGASSAYLAPRQKWHSNSTRIDLSRTSQL